MESGFELARIGSWEAAVWANRVDAAGELLYQALEQPVAIMGRDDQEPHQVVPHCREGSANPDLIGPLARGEAASRTQVGDSA
jgi:hypothetical protein